MVRFGYRLSGRCIQHFPSLDGAKLRGARVSGFRSHDTGQLSVFVEEFLRFVDLRGQVGAAAAIRVVEQHELAVLFADLVLVQGALSAWRLDRVFIVNSVVNNHQTYGSSRIKEASRRFIRGSNPLYSSQPRPNTVYPTLDLGGTHPL